MSKSPFDIIVVGAGIHGAAVALEAARAGCRVLVLEQNSGAAMATSSRSSKLIHGGLRYLESFSFSLVRECLLDRRRLLQEYPDLVTMRRFYIPIYRNTSRSRLLIRTGLSLYSILGGMDKYSRFSTVPKAKWSSLDGIKQEGLLAVFQYWDAQTDDKILTERLLAQACELGAEVRYQSEMTHCDVVNTGVIVYVNSMGRQSVEHGSHLVNASGPWVTKVLERCAPSQSTLPVDLVQGTHLELPGALENGIYYLEAPQDQRAIFAMPWYDRILLGTTETVFKGRPADVQPTSREISYLLSVFNHYFPDNKKTPADIIRSWAGLRVLPAGDGAAFSRSRDTVLLTSQSPKHEPAVISIFGGKLTSHYSTARKLLQLINNG